MMVNNKFSCDVIFVGKVLCQSYGNKIIAKHELFVIFFTFFFNTIIYAQHNFYQIFFFDKGLNQTKKERGISSALL